MTKDTIVGTLWGACMAIKTQKEVKDENQDD